MFIEACLLCIDKIRLYTEIIEFIKFIKRNESLEIITYGMKYIIKGALSCISMRNIY